MSRTMEEGTLPVGRRMHEVYWHHHRNLIFPLLSNAEKESTYED